jgi:hypothetical protein
MGDLFEPLIGDPASACDIAQERDDIILSLGSAEPGEQEAVVGDGLLDVLRAGGGER